MPIALDALVSHIVDGSRVAIASDFNAFFSGAAMEVTRALVRRRARNLKLLAVPSAGLQIDLLVGAGCVVEVECGSVIHAESGAPPRFLDAFHKGQIKVRESTCPAIFHGLTAAEKGAPFLPVRGVLGSGLVELRPDWKTITNPFDDSEPLVVVPAIVPDIALFHAPMCDEVGNVWIGRRRELALMAHASRATLVTVERVFAGDLMTHPELSAGTLSAVYIDAIAVCERGAWPFAMPSDYPEDTSHIEHYLEIAKTERGFATYLEEHVLSRVTA